MRIMKMITKGKLVLTSEHVLQGTTQQTVRRPVKRICICNLYNNAKIKLKSQYTNV